MKDLVHLSSLLVFCCLVFPSLGTLPSLHERFYRTINSAIPCFRLTNATHQIGCSASDTTTRGVLYFIDTNDTLDWLVNSGPHSPYIAMLEPEMFTGAHALRLRDSSRVNGILVRYNDNASDPSHLIPADLDHFSPERSCPNAGFGSDDSCQTSWNQYGTDLSFTDFGDFPVFALPSDTFEEVLDCFTSHNANGSGGIADYPLCSVELTADMSAVRNTETCFRRANVLTLLVNGIELCDPLGDQNVWGTLFELPQELPSEGIMMLATKLDSTAFFPGLSFGANNELAGIATLLAVVEQLGRLKRMDVLNDTSRPVMYAFFHGESWDYIGSSRMVYDMQQGVFPFAKDNDKQQLPQIQLSNIADFLELSQVGTSGENLLQRKFYVHGNNSALVQNLTEIAQQHNISVSPSSATHGLPPASLQRFRRVRSNFSGSVLAGFDRVFKDKFFGSRFDNLANLGRDDQTRNGTVLLLADLATTIAKTVLSIAAPNCTECINRTEADPNLISEVLYCFLQSTNCSLFRSVLSLELANRLSSNPLTRYVTADSVSNSETMLVFQLVAKLAGHRISYEDCDDCLNDCPNSTFDQVFNTTCMQGTNETDGRCYCVQSYTFYHTAKSPAFDLGHYRSTEYSTWVESRWTTISLRMYLVTYTLQEVAFLFCGLAMTAIGLLIGIQCNRKGRKIFVLEQPYVVN